MSRRQTTAGAVEGTTSSRDGDDWRDHAACLGADAELFFTPDGERGMPRLQRIRRAKAVCATCPVTTQCLDDALDHNITFGVWGGLDEEERRTVRRRVNQGQPLHLATTTPPPPTAPKLPPVTRDICGTGPGYRTHTAERERQCQPCRAWKMSNRYDLAPCGTLGAYARHLRREEPPCDDCRAAKADGSREYRSRVRQGPDTAELTAEIEHLADAGADLTRAAQAVGRSTEALATALRRRGRHDLLWRLRRAAA